MKLIVLGILIYFGYRLVSQPNDRQLGDKNKKALDDDDYIDYEEID